MGQQNVSTFRVLYRQPSDNVRGYYTEVTADTAMDAIWETAKTLDPSALFVSITEMPESTTPEETTKGSDSA